MGNILICFKRKKSPAADNIPEHNDTTDPNIIISSPPITLQPRRQVKLFNRNRKQNRVMIKYKIWCYNEMRWVVGQGVSPPRLCYNCRSHIIKHRSAKKIGTEEVTVSEEREIKEDTGFIMTTIEESPDSVARPVLRKRSSSKII